MPEGPSIVILKEDAQQFLGQKVISVSGNSKTDIARISGQTIQEFKTWGKHFLICFEGFTVKIHLLMFGSYRINERKETPARLSLLFENGELNFYTCSVQFLEGDINTHYEWSADVMNDHWNTKKAFQKLKTQPEMLVCDALLEQTIFSGVGNIIKNEVLYRIFLHPESIVEKVPVKVLKLMIQESRTYSFEFLRWKRSTNSRSIGWPTPKKSACAVSFR